MIRPIIFLGPSLPREEARQWIDADFRPPIRRGDLPAAIAEAPPLVGIIDGQFDQALPVSPGEIIAGLQAGVPILGAASMGALRAAELWGLGMMGVGRIFEMYRAGLLEADDEVALIFDPYTLCPLSEPLVNIRHALACAVRDGVIDSATEHRLIEAARELFFSKRTYPAILAQTGLPPGIREALVTYLTESQHDLKRDDARCLLREAARMCTPLATMTRRAL